MRHAIRVNHIEICCIALTGFALCVVVSIFGMLLIAVGSNPIGRKALDESQQGIDAAVLMVMVLSVLFFLYAAISLAAQLFASRCGQRRF